MNESPEYELTHPKVCRGNTVDTCIHDIFTNTKQDLGPCPRIHAHIYKTMYNDADPHVKRQLEREYALDLKALLSDADKRIRDISERLTTIDEDDLAAEAQTQNAITAAKHANEKLILDIKEIEALGKNGLVSQAQVLLDQIQWSVESVKQRTYMAKRAADPSTFQKLQPCTVCGSTLSRLDNDKRLVEHFTGRLHIGYSLARELYEKYHKHDV